MLRAIVLAFIIMAFGLGGLVGCGSAGLSEVKTQAASDLTCPEKYLDVRDEGNCKYYAVGCGKGAAYVVKPNETGATECCPSGGCTAVMQGSITSD